MSIALLLLLQLFSGDGDVRFADELMHQTDYFRAITEYKRVLYYATDDSMKNYCFGRISEAYRKSGKYESAVEYASELFSRCRIGSAGWYRANLLLGRAYGSGNMPQLALQYYLPALEYPDSLQQARLEIAMTYFDLQDIGKSLEYFLQVQQSETDSVRKSAIGAVIEDIRQYSGEPRKSPLLGSLYSCIIPGAGQVYSNHYYDAIQAFLYTTAAAAGTYAMYRYEHGDGRRPVWTYVGLGFTAMFHISNIVGAGQTAQYANWKIHTDVARRIHDRVDLLLK